MKFECQGELGRKNEAKIVKYFVVFICAHKSQTDFLPCTSRMIAAVDDPARLVA